MKLFSRIYKISSLFFSTNLLFLSTQTFALTISAASTVDVDVLQDPATRTITFIGKSDTANLRQNDIITALSANNVKIKASPGSDIILTPTTVVDWGSPYNLIINAPRNLIFNNGSELLARGIGNLILRADTDGNNNGTLIPPANNVAAVLMNGGGIVKVYYRATNFNQPNEFNNLIKVVSPGTKTTFMLINTFDELQDMNRNLAGRYALATNIVWPDRLFSPIGSTAGYFVGQLDGQGYTISNLKINLPTLNNVGLFGYASGSTIRNLHLVNADIRGNNTVGGIVGAAYNSSLINTTCSGTILANGYTAGGLIGGGNGYVIQSASEGIVQGNEEIGGLVGTAVTTAGYTIDNSYTKARVTARTRTAGGLLARADFDSTYIASYAMGTIFSPTATGGLVGVRHSGYTPKFGNSCWDIQRTGQSRPTSGAVQLPDAYGLTTEQMLQKASYIDWNFNEIWGIDEGKDYPYLLWTKLTPPFTSIPNGQPGGYKLIG